MDRPRGAEAPRAGRGISALAALLASAGLAFMPFGPAPVALASDPTTQTVIESSAPDASPSSDPTPATEPTPTPEPSPSDAPPSTPSTPDAETDATAGAQASGFPAEPYGPPATDATTGSLTTGEDASTASGPLVIGPPSFALVVEGADAPVAQAFDAPGLPLADLARFTTFRIRYAVENVDVVPAGIAPLLEVRGPGVLHFGPVPALEAVVGQPFYVTREWVPDLMSVGGFDDPGTVLGPTGEARPDGYVATGENPAPPLLVPAGELRTVEFSLRATADAAYLTTYEFRITDGGELLAAAPTGLVTTEAEPDPGLTPGQRHGAPADDLAAAALAAAPRYPLALAGPMTVVLATYRLTAPAAAQPRAADVDPVDSIHGPYSLTADACAACHSTHRAQSPVLGVATSQYGTCTTCHMADSSGATNVVDDYAAIPANDATTRSYHSHPLVATGHTLDESDPLAGRLNRHSECADCHQPHRARSADGTIGTDTSTGASVWFTSGRLLGVRGVKVVNGVAGSAPAYSLRVAESDTPEYEICLKCHSGYTEQLANDPAHPSRDREDLGIVLNPATGSYHPIEAAGTNATSAMGEGLLGTSPYKLWDWSTESVVRCSNCHGNALAGTAEPSAGSSLPAHASSNRGILLAPYRDRDLKPAYEAYSSGDFALCYLCHAEAPFVDASGQARTDTNFRYHGLHVSGLSLSWKGSGGLSIDDSSGAGQGLAICAECHFRPHGTAQAPGADDTANRRLVAFAPNVGETDGSRAWTLAEDGTSGTCTLTCHGKPHGATAYDSLNPGAYPVTMSIVASPAAFTDGTPLAFTYTLTNTSRTDLAIGAFAVTSSVGGACTTDAADPFRPGDTTSCTTVYGATSGDVAAGSITIGASASDDTYLSSAAVLVVPWTENVPASVVVPDGFDLGGMIATILFGAVDPGDAGPWGGPESKQLDLAANDRPAPLRRSTAARSAGSIRRRTA